MNRFRCFFLSLPALVLFCGSGISSGAIVFDFEDEMATFDATTDLARRGLLTSLSMSQGGHTIDISRGGDMFDLVRNVAGQSKPPVFGNVSLETFFDQDGQRFTINIAPPVQGFSLTWGDFDGIQGLPEDDDLLTLRAYSGPDGTGALAGSSEGTIENEQFDPDNFAKFTFTQTSVVGSSISSVTVIAGGDEFPHSAFYDSFELFVVPEPNGLVWVAAILLPCLIRRRAT